MKDSLVSIIFDSDKRKKILLLLFDGEKSREEIKTSLEVTSTALIPQIKKLKEKGLVIQNGEYYMLSPIGIIVVRMMKRLLQTIDVFEANRYFWQNRNLNGIPQSILGRFGELGTYSVIEPDLNYLFEFPKVFTENIDKANYIMIYNAYFHPDYPDLYSRLAEKGTELSIILTKSVFERMKNDYSENIKKSIGFENVDLFVSNNTTGLATLVTTDRCLFISLFTDTGQYDHRTIMSFDSNALQWSRDLFNCYVDDSERVTELIM